MSIEAKVATILSSYEAALSKGTSDGVQIGDVATIYELVTITDPDTGEPLGAVKKPRLKMEITDAQEKFSVAKSAEFYSIRRGGTPTRRRKRISSDPDQPPTVSTVLVIEGDTVVIDSPSPLPNDDEGGF